MAPASKPSEASKPTESAYSKSEHVHGKWATIASMLAMLVLTPPIAIYMWFIMTQLKGSVPRFVDLIVTGGFSSLADAWPLPTATAWQIIASFMTIQALLMLLVPGKEWRGPVSPAGNVPIYWCNGFQSYLISVLGYLALWRFGIFNACIVYDHFGEILSAMNIFSLVFCLFLYVKGYVAPSSSDWGSSGNFIQDYFWGMELYPRLGKYFDIKTFTNCRVGMMSWALLVVTYGIKQYETYGYLSNSLFISIALILIYITKFFYWEAGYWNTMDIMHDRAGYYLCWGCMVWVPSIYTSPAMYLVHHPRNLDTPVALLILLLGLACVLINYDSDRQRQHFRATEGRCLVWGRPPVKIEAQYVTEKGESKTSLLLASGWWGISRHFHYVPEIMASFFWTLPGLLNDGLQYFYVVYLTILLMDRAIRDDERCRKKYGKYWDQYCTKVPYKVIPYIY